jgi:tripartite-type tricarboxylate transporter receptor subunit TctC
MRGDSQMSMAFVGTAISFIQSGQVRAVAMATAQRYPALPDVPTFAESGMPQYQYNAWFGLLAPAKTPAAILKKVSEDVASAMKNADVIKRLETMGAIPLVSTPIEGCGGGGELNAAQSFSSLNVSRKGCAG